MGKNSRKLQKTKEREKKVQKKLREERAKRDLPLVLENKLKRKIRRVEKIKKELGDNIGTLGDEALLKMNNSVLVQLEKNAKILRELEREYEIENTNRDALNQQLEELGIYTLEDKMNYLHSRLAEDSLTLDKQLENSEPDSENISEENS